MEAVVACTRCQGTQKVKEMILLREEECPACRDDKEIKEIVERDGVKIFISKEITGAPDVGH